MFKLRGCTLRILHSLKVDQIRYKLKTPLGKNNIPFGVFPEVFQLVSPYNILMSFVEED